MDRYLILPTGPVLQFWQPIFFYFSLSVYKYADKILQLQ